MAADIFVAVMNKRNIGFRIVVFGTFNRLTLNVETVDMSIWDETGQLGRIMPVAASRIDQRICRINDFFNEVFPGRQNFFKHKYQSFQYR